MGGQITTAFVDGRLLSGSQPQLFITFHQFELSPVQAAGVQLIIAGTIVVLGAAALAWAQALLQRSKEHLR